MKNFKRFLSLAMCLLLCASLLLFGAGCQKKTAALIQYQLPEKFDTLKTTSVAENDRYSLIWNAEKAYVVLYDKIKQCEWSYVPSESLNPSYDAEGYEKNINPKVKSPISVKYYDSGTLINGEAFAYANSIDEDNFSLKKIENGLEMKCYFDKYKFAVPVKFILLEDGLKITVDVDGIEEEEEYCISDISIAPFFCSISNANADKDGYYMFMPSGSGTLIKPVTNNGYGVSMSEQVYGGDANMDQLEQTTTTESIRMPVYGVVNNGRGVFAIIDSGAESAYINTMVCQDVIGYSYIQSGFRIRGYQGAIQTLFTDKVVQANLYADMFTPEDISVNFYPLYDEDANYMGMANKYREYLDEKETLSKEKSDDTLLNLKFVGGIATKKFTFGIPSDDMLVATRFEDVNRIVTELNKKAGSGGINVNLIGFGKSGNDIGQVAGGAGINSKFGDEDDLINMSAEFKNMGVNLFMNFDIIRFRDSGLGLSDAFGKADAANGSPTEKFYYDVAFRTKKNQLGPYYLATRSKLSEVSNHVMNAANDWQLHGVSLDTLTSMVYSDYVEHTYFSGAHYDDQSRAIMNAFKTNGYKVAGSDANVFAAGLCSHVYDVPTTSTKYRAFSVDIPFYEIVLKGKVSMSGTSLNLATNKSETILKSAESGLGLTYTLIGEYDSEFINSAQNVFYGSVYWDDVVENGIRDSIISTVSGYKDYFAQVDGATIVEHEIINNDVRKTVFDNGISVYVNYGDTEFKTGDVTVPARDFVAVKGA